MPKQYRNSGGITPAAGSGIKEQLRNSQLLKKLAFRGQLLCLKYCLMLYQQSCTETVRRFTGHLPEENIKVGNIRATGPR